APGETTIGEWSTRLGLKAAGAFPPLPASHLSVTLLLASAPPAAARASSRPCRRTSFADAAVWAGSHGERGPPTKGACARRHSPGSLSAIRYAAFASTVERSMPSEGSACGLISHHHRASESHETSHWHRRHILQGQGRSVTAGLVQAAFGNRGPSLGRSCLRLDRLRGQAGCGHNGLANQSARK